ncbi:MAG: DegT/DnrJ/EryC1/StrS family aminotransferase [Lentisphaeria bacterium]|jgi:dTDP-4-amino-4,6-dideoxygalactose transaminase
MNIPYCKIVCDGNELAYLKQVLDSGWLTTATKAMELEKKVAEKVGAAYACAVNSCTAALHLGVEALGIRPGDKVFVPTMTFTASAEVIRYLGADPVLLDVDYGTSLVTPEILAAAIRKHPDVKVLILVHYAGQAAELRRTQPINGVPGILDLCQAHGIRLLEDAAHAFPTRHLGGMVGSFGDVTCFSFYANKTMTTGEGGMLVTNDEAIYRRCKVMRLHGINRDIWDRFTAKTPSWEYDVVAPGFKYNMPDINAAIGLAQLERVDEFREKRERCARHYYDHLAGIRGLDLPVCREQPENHAWHIFAVVLTPESPLGRNEFIEKMAAAGIGTSVHYKPLHRMTYYRNTYHLDPSLYPNAERLWQGTVSLPIYPTMTEDELRYVCDTVKQILNLR